MDDSPTSCATATLRPLAATIALLALVVAGLVAPASSAQAAAAGQYLRMSATSTAAPGHPVHLAITWVAGGKEVDGTVNLQRRNDGRWTHVRRVTVRHGAATTRITPGSASDWRLRGRTTSTAGVPTTDPAGTSNTVRVRSVSDWNRSAAPQLAAERGQTVDGHARFVVRWTRGSSAVTGTVNLQRRSGSSWVHLRQVAVTRGSARIVYPTSRTADYRLRASQVTSPPGVQTAHPYGTSGAVRVAGTSPVAPAAFRVTGAGWGHGVGLSQYGARHLAASGWASTRILQHYYSGASVASRDMGRTVAVQVLDGAASTSIRPSGGTARIRLGGSVVATVAAGTTFSVQAVSQGLRVRVGQRSWTTASTSSGVHVEWAATRYYQPGSSVDANVSISGAQGRYRHGRLELHRIGGGVNAVNALRLNDEYLYGIAEMPSSWPAHALRAQATAARSYAAANSSTRRSSCDCHLYDDTRSQHFTGWNKENETTYGRRWVDAVDATTSSDRVGQVVTHGGSVIPAYYFSSSGGRTQNSEDVWTAALPWARSVTDSGSLSSVNPNRSWSQSISQNAMRSAFGLPDVASVAVTSRTAGSGVEVATATSTSGRTARISGEQLRTRLGLRSTWISSIG